MHTQTGLLWGKEDARAGLVLIMCVECLPHTHRSEFV